MIQEVNWESNLKEELSDVICYEQLIKLLEI